MSASVADLFILEAKKLGRDPTFPEIFRQLHTRKQDGVTFVDDKAREVNERVTKLREQRLEQQEDLEVIDDSQIYVEAVQGKRSDRIYGIGSVGKLYRNNGCSTSASTSSTSTCTSGIEQQVQQLVDQRVEQVVNEKLDNRLKEVLKQMFPDQDINQLLSRAN